MSSGRLLFFSFCRLDNSNLIYKNMTTRGDVKYLMIPTEALHLWRGCRTPGSSQYIQVRVIAAAAARPLTLSILIPLHICSVKYTYTLLGADPEAHPVLS